MPACLPVCLLTYLLQYLPACLPWYLPVCQRRCLPADLYTYLPDCLPAFPRNCLPISPPTYLVTNLLAYILVLSDYMPVFLPGRLPTSPYRCHCRSASPSESVLARLASNTTVPSTSPHRLRHMGPLFAGMTGAGVDGCELPTSDKIHRFASTTESSRDTVTRAV